MEQYTVYADFNCPFCYALNERLDGFTDSYDFEWRPIQHMFGLDLAALTPEQQAELASEVFTVRHRAPDLPITLPPIRPSTRLATEAYAAASLADERLARALRRDIYRALWVEGADISDTTVLDHLLAKNELGGLEIDDVARTTIERWQAEWHGGPFEERIPGLKSATDRTLLGLVSPKEMEAFLRGDTRNIATGVICDFVPRQILMVVGQPAGIWQNLSEIRNDYDFQVVADGEQAMLMVESEDPPDMILIDGNNPAYDALSVCRALIHSSKGRDIPVVVFDRTHNVEQERATLQNGAADYVAAASDQAVFLSRLRAQMYYKRRLDHLRRLVSTDGLTAIPSRREFERTVEIEWRRAIRSKLNVAILLIDVDHFKAYNDHYGHVHGDGCLRRVAEALSGCARRAGDMFARYGGEEFAAILPDTNASSAHAMAERCRRAVENVAVPHDASAISKVVTVSVGLASVVPSPDKDLQTLIRTADAALYAAKAHGRNRTEVRAYGVI